MAKTLIIQSHKSPVSSWLVPCLDSVRSWSKSAGYDYQFMNDELFDYLTADLWRKTEQQRVVATDLARLRAIQHNLQRYETAVWCDADFLIFKPDNFSLTQDSFSLGREVWIQMDSTGQLRSHTKVHNAFLMFRRGNAFLDFYIDTAERLTHLHQGAFAPQFVGPKLLTAIHNVVQCPVMESAGMLSPLIQEDIVKGGGRALELFFKKSKVLPTGVNLCASLVANGREQRADLLVTTLLENGIVSL